MTNKCPQCESIGEKIRCSCGFVACEACCWRCEKCKVEKCPQCLAAVWEAYGDNEMICFDCRENRMSDINKIQDPQLKNNCLYDGDILIGIVARTGYGVQIVQWFNDQNDIPNLRMKIAALERANRQYVIENNRLRNQPHAALEAKDKRGG